MNPKFFRNGIVMLVLVVGTAALLFTWLTSSTTTTDTSYSQFLQNVQEGEVSKVVQEDNKLTVTPPTGQTYVVFAPGVPGLPNSDVYGDMQAAAEKGNKDARPGGLHRQAGRRQLVVRAAADRAAAAADHRRLHLLHDATGPGDQ